MGAGGKHRWGGDSRGAVWLQTWFLGERHVDTAGRDPAACCLPGGTRVHAEEVSFGLHLVMVWGPRKLERGGHGESRGGEQSPRKLLERKAGSGEPNEAAVSLTAGLRG